MRKIFLIACLVAVAPAFGQQLHTSSFYDMQGVIHNPSTAGTQGSFIGATYRSQWSSIQGGPQTATLFGSYDLPSLKIGLGGYIYNDKTGPTSRTGIQMAFAKHVPTGNGGNFSLGIEVKGQQYSLDKDKLTDYLGSDPVVGGSDNKFVFDAGFGVSYTNKKFQVGASVSQLIQSKIDFYSGNLERNEEGRLYRHYYFHGNYKFNIDGNTVLVPNILFIVMPNAPTEIQGGVRVIHNELFWWGVGYRTKQSFMLSAGVNIQKKFSIGYGFDLYKNPVSVYDGGSGAHEILLKYNFSK